MKKIVYACLFALLSVMVIAEDDGQGCSGGPGGGGGSGGGGTANSNDPNEMSGPLGVGNPETERFVKPGELLTYTIYFENQSNATAAAQEVYVTNPFSDWLDWSTFEMGEIAFGNQIDLGLNGKKGGTSEATMKGTNFIVRTSLTVEKNNAAGTRDACPYQDRLQQGAVEYVATTPTLVIDRTAKPAKDSATSTTVTNVAEDATFYACFITADEDKAAMTLSVDGAAMSGASAETSVPTWTNYCGVAVNWSLASDGLSATTIKVAGLPAGMKFTAKDIMAKGSKTEVETPANTIYGAPTAASKVDAKTGMTTPSKVKFTVTTAGKSSETYALDLVVLPLPAWAVGTFDGAVREGGLATMTVAANGKISGKLLEGGLTWALSAPYFDRAESTDVSPMSEVLSPVFLATVIGKSGKAEITNAVTVAVEEVAGARDVLPYLEGGYSVFIYFPPKAGKFEGYSAEIPLAWDGTAFSQQ